MPQTKAELKEKLVLGRFQYLVEKVRENNLPSVIGTYGRAGVIKHGYVVIWSETSQHFYVFRNVRDLKSYLELVPPRDRHYYEVIFSEARQRPKIDIDGGNAEYAAKMRNALKKIVGPDVRVIVTDSSSDKKFSRHLIVDKYYKNAEAAKAVMDDLIDAFGDKYIDESVYKDIQYFRLTGSSKIGGMAKRIITPGARFEDTLIRKY